MLNVFDPDFLKGRGLFMLQRTINVNDWGQHTILVEDMWFQIFVHQIII